MPNVYFFDLRDGDTNNYDNLSDDKYLLWDKKVQSMQEGDYCIIYCKRKDVLITSKIIKDNVRSKKEGGKWFVEYKSNKYYYVSGGGTEFIVFGKINSYITKEDLTISRQGGAALLTQAYELEFKRNKLPLVLEIIKEQEILELLNVSTNIVATNVDDTLRMVLLNIKKQIIMYGPPGTGKTFMTKLIAVRFMKEK